MTEERLEKVRKLREMKKFGKKVQIEVQQKREKEKRDMLEEVKNIFSMDVHDNELPLIPKLFCFFHFKKGLCSLNCQSLN